ncbi:Tyrosine-protein kinase BAZ1B [Nymphon striatum]|nr:Tyrosine-protein kinase BAZ1B [Nymphon striatum]
MQPAYTDATGNERRNLHIVLRREDFTFNRGICALISIDLLEYNDRNKLYNDSKWMCKCTGKNNLTYEEAVQSEKESRDIIRKQIQPYFSKVILDTVNKSSNALENLIEMAHSKLSTTLNVGEKVIYKSKESKNKIIATIMKVHGSVHMSCNDKENALKMKPSKKSELLPTLLYDLKTSDNNIITSVAAYNLSRTLDFPSKDMIQSFIKANFIKTLNEEWTLDPESDLKQTFSGGANSFKQVKDMKAAKAPIKRKLSVNNADHKLAGKKKKLLKDAAGTSPLKDFLTNTKKQSKVEQGVIVCSMEKNSSDKSTAKGKFFLKKSPALKKSSKSTTKDGDPKKSPTVNVKNKAKTTPNKKVSKKESIQASNKKRKQQTSNKSTPAKKMKQMTLLDMSMKTSSSKSSDTPAKKFKSPGKNKEGSSVKSVSKKSKVSSIKTPAKIKKSLSAKKIQKKHSNTKANKSKAQPVKKKQNADKKGLSTPQKIISTKSGAKTPIITSPILSNTNLQEIQFKVAMKRLLHLYTTCSKKHFSKTMGKFVHLYEPKLNSFIPEQIKELFLRRVDHTLSKKPLEEIKSNLREEFLRRKAVELGKKQNKIGTCDSNHSIDDKLLENLTLLPKPKLVSTPEGLPNELFGDVIMITEFINCYQGLLVSGPNSLVSADQLMDALVAGKKSFTVISHVLVILLQTLLRDQIAQDYEENKFKLNNIPVNEFTAAELVRLSMRTDDSADVNTSNDNGFESALRNDEVPEELIAEIETTEFYELEAESKLKIISGLCHRVLATYAVQEYKDGVHKKFSQILAKKRMEIKEENEMKKNKKQENDEAKSKDKLSDSIKSEDSKPEATLTSNNLVKEPAQSAEDTNQILEETDDLVSVVKNRRLLAKKALEEKEKEEQLKRQKNEELNKEIEKHNLRYDYMDALIKWKQLEQIKCIGYDRNHDRYWILSSVQPVLCVEKGWCSHLEYKIEEKDIPKEEEEDEDEEVESNDENSQENSDIVESSPDNIISPVEQQSTIPSAGQNLWFCYDSIEAVDELIKSLGTGIREKHLKTQLNRFYPAMQKISLKKKIMEDALADYSGGMRCAGRKVTDLRFADDIDLIEESEKGLQELTKRVEKASMKYGMEISTEKSKVMIVGRQVDSENKQIANNEETEELDSQDKLIAGLQDELIDFASDIKKGGMGTFENFDTWTDKVRKAKTVKGLGKFILDISKCILPRFFSKVFKPAITKTNDGDRKNSDSVVVKWWEDAILNCQTLSRLHVLAALLESCVKWDESSANIKCKVCRRKNAGTATIVCQKCRNGYHLSCLRPVIFAIPDVDWFCSACDPESVGLRSSKKNYAESDCGEEEGESDGDEDYYSSEEEEKQCQVCGGSGEDLISCSRCPAHFHCECHQPPLRNPPRFVPIFLVRYEL